MKKTTDLQWMPRVYGDIKRCRQFLRRKAAGRAIDRIHEVICSVRGLRENPCMNPVRKTDPRNGLQFRRHNVDQFVVIYVYFRPSAEAPNGLISIRAIRHAREEDVFWGVKVSGAAGAEPRGHLVLRDEG